MHCSQSAALFSTIVLPVFSLLPAAKPPPPYFRILNSYPCAACSLAGVRRIFKAMLKRRSLQAQEMLIYVTQLRGLWILE